MHSIAGLYHFGGVAGQSPKTVRCVQQNKQTRSRNINLCVDATQTQREAVRTGWFENRAMCRAATGIIAMQSSTVARKGGQGRVVKMCAQECWLFRTHLLEDVFGELECIAP